MRRKFYQVLIIYVLSISFLGCSPGREPKLIRVQDYNSCDFVSRSDKFRDLPYSWGEYLPIYFEFHYTIPQEYRPFFYESADLWNTKLDAEFIIIQNDINQDIHLNAGAMAEDRKNVIYWLDRSEIPVLNQNTSYDLTLGIAREWGFKTLFYIQFMNTDIIIIEDTINELIDTGHRYLHPRDRKTFEENLIKNTIAHEFGHTFGLDHNPYSSLMRFKTNIDTDLVRQPVGEEDINSLSCIYDLDRLREYHPLDRPYSI